MIERTWRGGTGDWYDPRQWIARSSVPSSYPLPGDLVRIASGEVGLVGAQAKDDHSFDDQTVLLGSTHRDDPAELRATNAYFQIYFDLVTPPGHDARLTDLGTSGFDGSLSVRGDLTIDASLEAAGEAADFVLTSDALLTVAPTGTLKLLGTVTLEAVPGFSQVAAGGRLVNDGDFKLIGTSLKIAAGATLAGTGTIDIGRASTLDVDTAAPTTQNILFGGGGATLQIGQAATFLSTIENFRLGDRIDLAGVTGDYAAFDAGRGRIDLRRGGPDGKLVASLLVARSGAGTLVARPDGSGGTIVTYAKTKPLLAYEIGAGDAALRANVVRATMTTAAGAPIDGSGVKIGIISDSFDATGTAAAAAKAGYLPYDAATGTAAVTVLADDPQGSDEGQAMAELIHQVAPGAALYFSSGGNSPGALAAAVTALREAGCSVITDDLGFSNEPYFQVTGRLDQSIERAIASGVNYFTAASNLGNAFLESRFDPMAAHLFDAPAETVAAQRFSNGTPYDTITATGREELSIDLQWDAPYPKPGDNTPDAVVMKLYDMQGDLVATSHQLMLAGSTIPEVEIDLKTPDVPFTDYQLAITHADGTPVIHEFSVTLTGSGDGSGPGGYFDDPAAEQGAGTTSGHDLVPGANTVGAADWTSAPIFKNGSFAEGFSSSGPGELLFGPNGQRLPTPVSDHKVDFLAPDGVDVSTPGFKPFFGTSAAAPDAAAVAALMLQANPDLTPAEVTSLLEASATSFGEAAALQGAGLIQADKAVALAAALADPTLALDRPALTSDAGTGTTRVTLSGTSDAVGQTVDIFRTPSSAPLASAVVAADGTWSVEVMAKALAGSGRRLEATVAGTGGSAAQASQAFVAPFAAASADGATTFVLPPGFGQDIIRSFAAAGPQHDTIRLPDSDATRLGAILASATTDAAGDTTLTIDAHDAVTLTGVGAAELKQHRHDFLFHA